MERWTDKYIDMIRYFSSLYDFFNLKLFNNELTKPVITIQRDERNKTRGWWTVDKVWRENVADECNYELNLTAQELGRPIESIASTLLHEMCHQYATMRNLQDTSRSGNYHNKMFKRIAEHYGLKVDCVEKYGYAHTELTDETKALLLYYIETNPYKGIYRKPVLKGQSVKSSSTRKYACPICGQSVRATKAVNILCLDCNLPMTEE